MRIKTLLLIGASAAGVLTTAPALAQSALDEQASTGDIVVTATRREQRLQEVPLAVSALSSETLRDRGIASAADLGSGKVPGLNINSMFGSETAVALNIRGYGTSDPSQGTQDQAAAFYIDGINFPRAQGMALELITPERIEVLRGPQGQLFGRNAEAGAIQIVSKRPTGTLSGDLSGGYGNFDTKYLKGRIDLPEIYGFKIQVSGSYRAHDGYIKNKRNPLLQNIALTTNPQASFHFPVGNYDQDLSQLDSHGWRIAVERQFGLLNAYYTFDNSWAKDDQGMNWFMVSPNGGIQNPTGVTGAAASAKLFSTNGTFSFAPLTANGDYPRDAPFSQMYVPFVNKSYGHSLTLSLEASDRVTLKSITGWRTTRREGGNMLTIALSSVQPTAYEYLNSSVFSHEFQANYNTHNFNLTAGLIYFEERVKDERDAGFSTNCFGDLNRLNPLIPVGTLAPCDTSAGSQPVRQIWALSSSFKRTFARTEAYAAYGQASWTPGGFDDKLELTAGLRYSNDTKSAVRTINGGVVLATPISNEAKTNRVDPAAMIKYQWTPDVNTYVRYARGFRDGGANVRSNIFSAYGTETLDSFELGMKSQWLDRRVTLNAAIFRNIIRNQQQALQSNPAINPSITDTINMPTKYKTTGVEVELSVRPLPGLQISGNYTYLNSNTNYIGLDLGTLRSFALTNPTICTGSADPRCTGVPAGSLIPSASDLAAHPVASTAYLQIVPIGAPKHSGSVSLDYTAPVGSLGNFAFHGEWVRASAAYVASPTPLQYLPNAAGTSAAPKPFYLQPTSTNRVNGRIALRDIPLASGVKAEISLWGKNIFNHLDVAHSFGAGNALNAASPAPQSAVYLQPPRTYGAELRVQF